MKNLIPIVVCFLLVSIIESCNKDDEAKNQISNHETIIYPLKLEIAGHFVMIMEKYLLKK
jgi:hypothetical protein